MLAILRTESCPQGIRNHKSSTSFLFIDKEVQVNKLIQVLIPMKSSPEPNHTAAWGHSTP